MNSPKDSKGYVMAACDDESENAVYPITIISKNDDFVEVKYENNTKEEIPASEILPIDPNAELGCPDLKKIKFLNEASVLINLQKRFEKKLKFTRLENVLVFINSFDKKLKSSHDKNEKIKEYKKILENKAKEFKEPGIHTVINPAKEKLNENSQNILILGESGSGKTKIFNKIIKSLTEGSEFYDKITATLKILQTLGNNFSENGDFSSSFMAHCKIYFKKNIAAGFTFEISDLEKKKLLGKKFKIFSMRKFFKDDPLIESLSLETLQIDRDSASDNLSIYSSKYESFRKSLQILNLNTYSTSIWRIITSILCLFRLEFEEKNFEIEISQRSSKFLQYSSLLLSIPVQNIINCLTKKTRKIGKTIIESKLDLEDCLSALDSFIYYTYTKLVKHLKHAINSQFKPKNFANFIGITDTFGFECLENNNFEQLLRNYSSEKFQNFVIDSVFKKENTPNVNFTDNTAIVELIDNKIDGIFKLIDESCAGNEENLANILKSNHISNEYFAIDSSSNYDNFVLYHSLGTVKYMTKDFKLKNIDEVYDEFQACLNFSENDIMLKIFTIPGSNFSKNFKTQTFSKELSTFIDELLSEKCSFVYCLKSNNENRAWKFNQKKVLSQIQSYNLLDLVVLFKNHEIPPQVSLESQAVTIQKNFRMFIVKNRYLTMKKSINFIKSCYLARKQSKHYQKTLSSIILIQRRSRVFLIRISQIKKKLSEFLIKEQGLLSNLRYLEHSNLFSNLAKFPYLKKDPRLELLSNLTESSARLAKSNLTSSGSLAIQVRKVNPFHLEKLYFFCRVLLFDLICDNSVIYAPLWSTQLEVLNKECIDREEQLMDIQIGLCHSVALTNRGKVFVWGWNDKNQCGSQGKKARLFEKLKEKKIVQVKCGDNHTIALDSNGEVFTFGDNENGQLGIGTYSRTDEVFKLNLPKSKSVSSKGSENFVVSESGELYVWPFEISPGVVHSFPTRILSDVIISEVSVGFHFSMILTASGVLYAMGNNAQGQLGLGDFESRKFPVLVSYFRKIGEKIAAIDCGFSHCIAKSTLGKAFCWGSGSKGQLGTGLFENETFPKIIKNKGKVIQVAAGHSTSQIMLENRRVLTCGNGNNEFSEINIGDNLPEFAKNEEFAVTRIFASWSRILSVSCVVFTDLRYVHTSYVKLQNGINSLASKWSKNIDPELVDTLAGYYPMISCRKSPLRSNSNLRN